MSEDKVKIIALNLEAYEPHSASEIVGNNAKWVRYGDDNDFLEYLLDRYYGSPTNNAVIKGVAQMIVGGGLYSPLAQRRPDAYAKAMVMFRIEDLRRWAFDLKYAGFFLIQVLKTKTGYSTKHTSVELWRSGIADEDGNVNEWYYSDNWQKCGQAKFKPVPYPAYKKDTTAPISILAVKPFTAGTFYYPAPDYMGALAYAHLEEEIATFHLNNVLNGLQPGMLVNFNNGDPGEDLRNEIERKINAKWKGAKNAGRMILAFNDNKDAAATIESAPINDLDKQFQFLSTETTSKVMLGHRVTSPLLFGIRAEGGLGNNANELTEAYRLFDATVLSEYRSIMIEALEGLLNDIGVNIPLGFKPNAYFEPKQALQHLHSHEDMTEDDEAQWLDWLYERGETIDHDEYDLVLEEPVDTSGMTLETELGRLDGKPQAKSLQDQGLYKIRYAYSPDTVQSDSRTFCKEMVKRNKEGMVYRKEDILIMGELGVNGEFAPRGESKYSIWLYKGGVNCHHFWMRRIYIRKRDAKGFFKPKSETKDLENEQPVSVNKAKKEINIPINSPKVAQRPIDMPNHGRKPR